MTDYTTLQKKLTEPSQKLDLAFKGMLQAKTADLTSSNKDVEFAPLGFGTNKSVFKIKGSNWVLAIANGARGASDLEDEVRTLKSISNRNIRVPKPFSTKSVDEILIEVNGNFDGIEDTRTAFLQEFLPYEEMKKSDRPESFVERKLIASNPTKKVLVDALSDLIKISRAYTANPWGDFQVMCDLFTGQFYVFDPMPTPNPASFGLMTPPKLLERWMNDIERQISSGKYRR